jgi:Fe-S oxidoreductase
MRFNPFVLPFITGLIFMFLVLIYRYTIWFFQLSPDQRNTIKENIFSISSLRGFREVFNESLLHKKIFAKNRLLGYMHMSLALGWFLLILVGHFETSAYFHKSLVAPYIPVFIRYFQTDATHHTAQIGYWFIMDTLLLFVLSGVFLAWYKRRHAAKFGLKKATDHVWGDRLALSVLWFIFPLRLMAESITSILYGGGSYLTFGLGSLMEGTLANQYTFYITWWGYSLCLGLFFIALPFSRYLHIPTEAGLIMLRHWGALAGKEKIDGVSQFELHSCSSCGICLDSCQMVSDLNSCYSQSPYLFKSVRNFNLTDEKLNDCLMCGRCIKTCVVGINTTNIRQVIRNKNSSKIDSNLSFLEKIDMPLVKKSDVIYFAGCMSHLTPGIKKAMTTIFETAGVYYAQLDQYESICCGRPMILAGMSEQAAPLINKNKELIEKSGAKMLVTSCPICFKVFKESYGLKIEVLHHTQYLDRIIDSGKLKLKKSPRNIVYHDPCELGRGSGVYNEPRNVLKKVANLQTSGHELEDSLCCGGSLANTILTSSEKSLLANSVLDQITTSGTQTVVTSCPLCKKTFASAQKAIEVKDIAEMVEMQLADKKPDSDRKKKLHEELVVR